MKPDQIREGFKTHLSEYVKYAHIARVSGGTRQHMNWWLKADAKGSHFDPEPGLIDLKLLCLKLSVQPTIENDEWKQLKKFLNMSSLCDEVLDMKSSTFSVNISRKGLQPYVPEIQKICGFMLKKLSFMDTKPQRKKKKKKTKKIALKLKKR